MRQALSPAALLLLVSIAASAQQLRVWSEFQRVDPFGNVIPPDRTEHPREILSPLVARDAWASFHIVATIPQRQPYFLYIQTNPEKIFDVVLYKELCVKSGGGWIPDALQRVTIPSLGSLPWLPNPIPGQNTVAYWMDLWTPASAPAERVRLEIILKIGTGWVVYPMEIRVAETVIPGIRWRRAAVPAPDARADVFAEGPVNEYLHHRRERHGSPQPLSVRDLIRRNSLQEVALARELETRYGRQKLVREFEEAESADSEWHLRLRERLYRLSAR